MTLQYKKDDLRYGSTTVRLLEQGWPESAHQID